MKTYCKNMKFISYNIQNGGNNRIFKIINVLKDEMPDFLAIIEANGFEKNNFKKLKELSEKLELKHYHLELSSNSDSHIAILSKYPLSNIRHISLFKRAGVVTNIETEYGNISVAVVHFAPNTEDTRLDELDKLIILLRKCDTSIILGDFNSLSMKDNYSLKKKYFSLNDEKNCEIFAPRFDVISKLEQLEYTDVAVFLNMNMQCTVPITIDGDLIFRNLRLDYVFISKNLITELLSYTVVNNSLTKDASDHFPVIVEFKYHNMINGDVDNKRTNTV